jgi:hypothetical protein
LLERIFSILTHGKTNLFPQIKDSLDFSISYLIINIVKDFNRESSLINLLSMLSDPYVQLKNLSIDEEQAGFILKGLQLCLNKEFCGSIVVICMQLIRFLNRIYVDESKVVEVPQVERAPDLPIVEAF